MMYKPFFKFLHLVTLSALTTMILAISTMPPSFISYYVQEIQDQRGTIEETTLLYKNTLTQLQAYKATEADLMAIGASPKQAQDIIAASELYHISPKH